MNDTILRSLSTDKSSPVQGAILKAMAAGGNLTVAALRALSPLSERAQVVVDRAVVEVGLQRLSFVADLLAEGLTYNLPDPLSVTQLEWERVNQIGGAQRTMTPSARGERQMPKRDFERIPIYLTTDDFSLDIRTLRMSERVGQPLDTTLVGQATRRVNEALEDAAINGTTTPDGQNFTVAGYGAPGLLNAPNANTHTIAVNWNTATGEQIRADVMTMIGKAQTDLKFGPYNLYVPTAVANAMTADFKANGNDSIGQRLESITVGGRPLRIRATDMMPATKVALVQMTSDVVDIVDGQRPTVIPWISPDGFTFYWMVMAIMVQRVRDDYNGGSGIVIGTQT